MPTAITDDYKQPYLLIKTSTGLTTPATVTVVAVSGDGDHWQPEDTPDDRRDDFDPIKILVIFWVNCQCNGRLRVVLPASEPSCWHSFYIEPASLK